MEPSHICGHFLKRVAAVPASSPPPSGSSPVASAAATAALFPCLADYDPRTILSYEAHHPAGIGPAYSSAMALLRTNDNIASSDGSAATELLKALIVLLLHNASAFVRCMDAVDKGSSSFAVPDILKDKRVINRNIMRYTISAGMMDYGKPLGEATVSIMQLIASKHAHGSSKLPPASLAAFLVLHCVTFVQLCYSDFAAVAELRDFLAAALKPDPSSALYLVQVSGSDETWLRRGDRLLSTLLGTKLFSLVWPEHSSSNPSLSLLCVVMQLLRQSARALSPAKSRSTLLPLVLDMLRLRANPKTQQAEVRLNENIGLMKLLRLLLTPESARETGLLAKEFICHHIAMAAESGMLSYGFAREPFRFLAFLMESAAAETAYGIWTSIVDYAETRGIEQAAALTLKSELTSFVVRDPDVSEQSLALANTMRLLKGPLCNYSAPARLPLSTAASDGSPDDQKLIAWISSACAKSKACARRVLQAWLKEAVGVLAAPEKLFGLYHVIYTVLTGRQTSQADFYALLFLQAPPKETEDFSTPGASKVSAGPAVAAFLELSEQDLISGLLCELSLRHYRGLDSISAHMTSSFFVHITCDLDEACGAVANSPGWVVQALEQLGDSPVSLPSAAEFLRKLLVYARTKAPEPAHYLPLALADFAVQRASLEEREQALVLLIMKFLADFAVAVCADQRHQVLLGSADAIKAFVSAALGIS